MMAITYPWLCRTEGDQSMRKLMPIALLLALASCRPALQPAAPIPQAPDVIAKPEAPPPKLLDFTATAYTIEGRTATGERAREGIVAADPDVLPLGSRIRVHGAGQYSGEYVVKDTGKKVQGRTIDIYVRDDAEAKRFGRKRVKVEVLSRADRRP